LLTAIIIASLFLLHLGVSATKTQPGFDLLLADDPVVHEIEVESFPHEEFPHHRYQLLVVGFLFKF
jgi:hypothetical protein